MTTWMNGATRALQLFRSFSFAASVAHSLRHFMMRWDTHCINRGDEEEVKKMKWKHFHDKTEKICFESSRAGLENWVIWEIKSLKRGYVFVRSNTCRVLCVMNAARRSRLKTRKIIHQNQLYVNTHNHHMFSILLWDSSLYLLACCSLLDVSALSKQNISYNII